MVRCAALGRLNQHTGGLHRLLGACRVYLILLIKVSGIGASDCFGICLSRGVYRAAAASQLKKLRCPYGPVITKDSLDTLLEPVLKWSCSMLYYL